MRKVKKMFLKAKIQFNASGLFCCQCFFVPLRPVSKATGKMVKYTTQIILGTSPESIVWTYISSGPGLERWFADSVIERGREFSFCWQGSERTARVVEEVPGERIRFHWLDAEPDTFWELRIEVDEITDDTILCITDFAEEGEEDDDKQLWRTQGEELKHVLGCR